MSNPRTKECSDDVRSRFVEPKKALVFRNVDDEKKGKLASATGFANEQRFLATLLSRGYNASRVDLPHSSYDIITELEDNSMIRVQVKTVGSSKISFTGGTRSGSDRTYKSDIKKYKQSRDTSDIVVGVKCRIFPKTLSELVDYFFVPTYMIQKLNQESLSINKIPYVENNWELFENCKDESFVKDFFLKNDPDDNLGLRKKKD